MDDYTSDGTYIDNPKSDKVYNHEGKSPSGKGMQMVGNNMGFSTRIDLDLAYSSEKLVNLHVLLMHLLAWDNDLEVMAAENDYISATSIEKALVFDLLSGILDSEVREVEDFTDDIQREIVDSCHEISSCRNSTEILTIMEKKLHASEESLKKFQEQLLEVKMESAKLQRAFSAFKHDKDKDDKVMELSPSGQLSNTHANSKSQTAEQQRHVLRMLEKSLARELDLEKKLSELRQNEEHLKLKMHYTEQVAFHMEEAAQGVWGRFLEAENAAEVLMGISKELVAQLQIIQFDLNGSFQREAELKYELQDCIKQLDAKDAALKKLENSIAEHITKGSQVPALTEKVKSLEEQLKKSEFHLENANVLNEESQEQLNEMENLVKYLQQSIYEAESRAQIAEAKVTTLTDSNLELTEEINFLKSSRDGDTKKISLLEKQLRELEIQVQHAKVSSEASQEQQNMLYSAIWDMETLIEDLKSKASKAESKTERVEEQCIVLSETNFELDKEISFLRSRVRTLETSLDQANKSKAASAKEIDLRARHIMDTVIQLARERERIQNQLFSLTKESKILVEKQSNGKQYASTTMCDDGDSNDKKLYASVDDSSNESCGKVSAEAMFLTKSIQADEPSKDGPSCETEVGTSYSTHEAPEAVSNCEAPRSEHGGHLTFVFVKAAIYVAFLSAIIIYLSHKKPMLFDKIFDGQLLW